MSAGTSESIEVLATPSTGRQGRDLTRAAQLVATGELSPVQLVHECLQRAEAGAAANAFTDLFAEDALRAARALQELLHAGHRLGPLHGVPVAIKDNIDIAGKRSTAGSSILADRVASTDAPVVAKLRSAGAIVIGHTGMHEFAWGGTSDNPHTGTVRNAYDLERTPGGSSGGSAVAVALGACCAALGTDTGGSVRLPAALNGVTGLRPGIGRIDVTGVVPLAWSMDTVGPMARSARDCTLLTAVLTGQAVPARRRSNARGLRIGLIEGYSLTHLQAPVEEAFRSALNALTGAGAVLVDVNVEDVEGNISAQLTVEAAEPSTYHQQWLRQRPQDYGADVRLLLEAGELLPATTYLQAQRYRSLLRDQVLQALEVSDVLATPTLPFTATPIGASTVEVVPGRPEPVLSAIMQFTGLPSLTGLPAVSVPCGIDEDGLPIGMQLIGRPGGEMALLEAAEVFQELTHFHLRTPTYPLGTTER
ncbi:amidase [Kineococcus sp. SYSU DK005]|uniref:amidase n=1 Tax=Kineococcus sp. SYSU DK005 TaxID=3383126 RepID=UPI003D7F0EC0